LTDIRIRIATKTDEQEILSLIKLIHAEGGIQSINWGRVQHMVDFAFDRKGGIIGVIGETGSIRGMIFLLITKAWYTEEDHIEELLNFVHPDYRKSNYANDLIEFAKECARQIGIPLMIGVMSNIRTAPKVRLYRKKLGTPSGAYFVYNCKWDVAVEPTIEDFWTAIESKPERRARERINNRLVKA
jgi:GNAT superfamily N-acetyltransferase